MEPFQLFIMVMIVAYMCWVCYANGYKNGYFRTSEAINEAIEMLEEEKNYD